MIVTVFVVVLLVLMNAVFAMVRVFQMENVIVKETLKIVLESAVVKM